MCDGVSFSGWGFFGHDLLYDQEITSLKIS